MKTIKKKAAEEPTEDWEKEMYLEVPETMPRKFKRPPKDYQKNFLARLDGRTEVFRILNTSYKKVVNDMGGEDSLSHVQIVLAERFVFLEYLLQNVESRIASEPKKAARLLGKWIQGVNSLSGLSKTIGLERKARKVVSLQSYVKEKNNGE